MMVKRIKASSQLTLVVPFYLKIVSTLAYR